MMAAMHPALAGLIGAGLAILLCFFVYLIRRGVAARREIEAARTADRVSPELREVLTTIRNGALLVGPDDEILVVNDVGEAMGLAHGNRVGFPALLERVRSVRGDGQPFSGVVVREREPGVDKVELSVHVVALSDDKVVVIAVDESTLRRIEAARRDFVANISHELKTPIGAISVLAEAIEAARDDPEAVEKFSGRLQRETARLTELTQQIIELSRLQTEDPMLNREVVDLWAVVDEAVARCRERADSRHVSLTVARTAHLQVAGDRWQLADAVANLTVNAINYSDERARVAISLAEAVEDGQHWAEIKVSDNGIGIKPEDLDRIFERFYRVDYGRSRESGGTGLGLSIVKHIARAHGGSVRVWSRPGHGSTFTLRLPMYRVGPHYREIDMGGS